MTMRDEDEFAPLIKSATSDIGADLSTWSVGDIEERIAELEAEIARLRAEKDKKQGNLSAAEAFFKSPK